MDASEPDISSFLFHTFFLPRFDQTVKCRAEIRRGLQRSTPSDFSFPNLQKTLSAATKIYVQHFFLYICEQTLMCEITIAAFTMINTMKQDKVKLKRQDAACHVTTQYMYMCLCLSLTWHVLTQKSDSWYDFRKRYGKQIPPTKSQLLSILCCIKWKVYAGYKTPDLETQHCCCCCWT